MDNWYVFDDMKETFILALRAEQVQGEAFLASIVQHAISQRLHDAIGGPKQVAWSKASRCILLGVCETLEPSAVHIVETVQGLIDGIVGMGEDVTIVTTTVARAAGRVLSGDGPRWSFDVSDAILRGARRAALDLGANLRTTLEAAERGLLDVGIYGESGHLIDWVEGNEKSRAFA